MVLYALSPHFLIPAQPLYAEFQYFECVVEIEKTYVFSSMHIGSFTNSYKAAFTYSNITTRVQRNINLKW